MENTRITVAVPGVKAAEKIRYALQRTGYTVADVCTSSSEMLRRVRLNPPDVLLINFDMSDMTGLEAASIVGDESLCSVLLLVTSAQRKFCVENVENYDITMFVKPLGISALLSAIDTVVQSRNRMLRLSEELFKLKKGMQERKLVERAKGILMNRKSISEAEAYRRLQKMSMDSRVSMKDIATKLIELSG